ncbi:MAG TPA: hypothetical protein PKI93_00130 [Alphaproteobacteria bacterium]|nr:hypothetical protein [Alphaproteobacteria bacterium]HNS43617.1 hypothetical protein [Alphaproteobacteria bacterium]
MKKPSRKFGNILLAALVGVMVLMSSGDAYAWKCKCCNCICPWFLNCCKKPSTKNIIEFAFDDYRTFFIMDSFYKDQFEKEGLQPMADQWRDFFTTHAMMVGAFLDGYAADAAQANVQSLNANTIRDYQVSDQICKFGTLARSLAGTDSRLSAQQMVMSEIALARNIGTVGGIASSGRGQDNQNRLYGFMEYYCDGKDNNNGLGYFCKAAGSTRDVEYNRDIDFTRTIDDRSTLNVDLTNNTLSRDEKDVVFLGHMLYGHRQDTKRARDAEIKASGGAEKYLLTRSVAARRSVAENTYNAIVAMKAAGSGSSKAYITAMLTSLGMSAKEILKYTNGAYLGATPYAGIDDAVSPSYYTQMEILTKRLYQDPTFYANLMDTKANVKRTSTAMDGLSLAQDRDIFKSMARSEMLLALLLELESGKRSDEISAQTSQIIGQP